MSGRVRARKIDRMRPRLSVVSQHSMFDEPSRLTHRVQAYRRHGAHRRAGLFGVALLVVAVVASAIALALHS
jgi:hypothetical protein